ncbi:hypothetical protein IAS59_002082 [Cryptococcus gattii]
MAISPPSTPGVQESRAWVTLVTNSSYVAGLLTLHRTLSSLSSYPLLVMTTPSLPGTHSSLLRSLGFKLITVSHLSPSSSQHPGFDPQFSRLNEAWTKLDMDKLFDLELPGRDWIGASPACVCNPFKLEHYPKDWIPANCSYSTQQSPTPLLSLPIPSPCAPRTSHLLNSGLVILHPSLTVLASLIDFLNTSPTIGHAQFADQDVIAEAFKGRWRPLPWWCNALKTLRGAHKDLWRDEEVGIIHYILDKPWSARPASLPPHQPPSPTLPPSPASLDGSNDGRASYLEKPQIRRRSLPHGLLDAVRNTPPQRSLTNYDEVHAWWWIVYEDLLDDLKARGVDWESVDMWVTR